MPKLIPYPSSPDGTLYPQGPLGLQLEAEAKLEGSGDQKRLVLSYSAGGVLDRILWPASLASKPKRKDGLWKHTCFEAFVKPANGDAYWEINLSPTGDWNVYRFTSYRQGMTRDDSVQALSPVFSLDEDKWRLTSEIWLPEWAYASSLEVGLTSVIEETSGAISYWAIHHVGTQPDFHLAQSFTSRIRTI